MWVSAFCDDSAVSSQGIFAIVGARSMEFRHAAAVADADSAGPAEPVSKFLPLLLPAQQSHGLEVALLFMKGGDDFCPGKRLHPAVSI